MADALLWQAEGASMGAAPSTQGEAVSMQAEATMLEGFTPIVPTITAATTAAIMAIILAITDATTLQATFMGAAGFMPGAVVIIAAAL